jgi:cilia- and flagella-associated protein 57
MSLGKVIVKNAFGFNTKLKGGLGVVDDHQLVYVCGQQVVSMNTETKEQQFIVPATQSSYQSYGICSISCSPSKKTIAVAEIVDPVAIVTLYDSQSLRRRKVLQYPELGSKEIRAMAFSNDGKLCITQGAGPEWNLVLWNVEKAIKILGCVKISMSDENPVNQVSFCPWDANVILVLGKGLIRIFRVSEGQLRPVSVNVRRDQANFISHTWLWDDKLLLGTAGGEILFLEGLEFKAIVHPLPNDTSDPSPILSLAPISKGFVAGTTGGEMWSFSLEEDIKEQYRREEVFYLPKREGGIISICVTADDALICATDTQQLFQFNLTNSSVSKDSSGHSSGFDYLFTGFHKMIPNADSSITGIDVALWKPIIVTCSKDHTVRVWNLIEKRVEITKYFQEEPCALSVHPSGLYVVIAFTDKIRIASVLLDDIAVTKELNIRGCNEVRFSRGGQYIAAVNGANVQIFNTYSGAIVSTLRGHTAKVRAIVWMHLDSKLMTVGQEGTVYFWEAFTGSRSPDCYIGVVPVTAGTALSDGSKAYTISNERQLKEIPMKKTFDATTGQEVVAKQPKDVPVERYASVMAIEESNKILFMGTCDPDLPGSVISVMTVPNVSSSLEITALHSGPITTMCLSKDGSLLITGDCTGVLLVCDIEGPKTMQAQKKIHEGGMASNDFIEEILIRKSDLDARRLKAQELTQRVEELTLNSEHQLRLKELEHKDKIQEITERFTLQLQNENTSYESYISEKQEAEKEFKYQLTSLDERHEKELKSVENRYNSKLSIEAARHQQLQIEIEESHKKWNAENSALVESHQSYLSKLTEEYESKLNEEHQSQKNLQQDKTRLQTDYDRCRGNIEGDADNEIDDMKTRFEMRLKQEEETCIALMADHAVMKKNLQMLNKDSETHREEIKRLRDKEVRLIETIRSLEKDIQSHKKEIRFPSPLFEPSSLPQRARRNHHRQREAHLRSQEKEPGPCLALSFFLTPPQELEKFRFVLDYKIKELKLQIAPRENEITVMQRQIEDMDLELEQYHKSNLALNLMIGELKLKLEGLRKELLSQTSRVEINSKLLERFMRDLQEVWSVRQDYSAMKAKVVQLYRIYVQEDVLQLEEGGGGGLGHGNDVEGPQRQYNRDREQMERSLDALRKSLHTDSKLHKRDLSKMMRENVLLTKEMNDLRKEAHTLQLQKQALQASIESGNRSNINEVMEMLGFPIKASATATPAASASANMENHFPPPPSSAGGGGLGSTGLNRTRRAIRSTALRHVSSSGGGEMEDPAGAVMRSSSAGTNYKKPLAASRSDLREAWREFDMQTIALAKLEDQLRSVCLSLGLSAEDVLVDIENTVQAYELG